MDTTKNSFYTLSRFLGVEQLSVEGRKLTRLYTLMIGISSFILSFTNTYFIIYIIEVAGIAKLGIIIAVLFLTQSIVDFPTGVLSDWLSQRLVLSLGSIINSLAFLLLAVADAFDFLILVAILLGIANALNSGAYETWLGNNYRNLAMEDDPDRKIYGFFLTRVNVLIQLISAIAFILGGITATRFTRKSAFIIEAIFSFVFSIVILLILTDRYEKSELSYTQSTRLQQYFSLTQKGIKFLFSSRLIFFFIFGSIFTLVSGFIWFNLILFVLYYGYTGTDASSGLLRTIVFIPGALVELAIIARLSKRLTSMAWLYRLHIVSTITWYGSFAILLFYLPLNDTFNILGIILTIIIMSISGPFFKLVFVMEQRFMLDLVPDSIRNAVYSLIPSLVTLIAVPLVIVVSSLNENINYTTGIVFLILLESLSVIMFFIAYRQRKSWKPAQKGVSH